MIMRAGSEAVKADASKSPRAVRLRAGRGRRRWTFESSPRRTPISRAVRRGVCRADSLDRFAGSTLTLLPLRERPDDVLRSRDTSRRSWLSARAKSGD